MRLIQDSCAPFSVSVALAATKFDGVGKRNKDSSVQHWGTSLSCLDRSGEDVVDPPLQSVACGDSKSKRCIAKLTLTIGRIKISKEQSSY